MTRGGSDERGTGKHLTKERERREKKRGGGGEREREKGDMGRGQMPTEGTWK
jgi:hypothetical protein